MQSWSYSVRAEVAAVRPQAEAVAADLVAIVVLVSQSVATAVKLSPSLWVQPAQPGRTEVDLPEAVRAELLP